MKHYDYLIVGSGLFGATFAYRARQAGKRCLVMDKFPHFERMFIAAFGICLFSANVAGLQMDVVKNRCCKRKCNLIEGSRDRS